MSRLTVKGFLSDKQGSRYRDAVDDPRLDFEELIRFFSDPKRQLRMEDSEKHHDRPALAGVVRELENTEPFRSFFLSYDGHTTQRMRQAVGVIVRIVMEKRGWSRTGRKGALGQRTNVRPRTTRPGAYYNTSGLSWWFTRSERYQKPDEPSYAAVGRGLPPGASQPSVGAS